ncbi:hypothetical protein [Streptomyces sp. NPDC052494]|uniref:hypothetical protein n=1 Tax=Streptomyces sp. NPDC052494 TaxID=3365692 RepID=UPI0037D930C7
MTPLLLLISVPLVFGLVFWLRPLLTGRWRHSPLWFAASAVPLLLGTGVVYLAGSLSGGSLDPEEACHMVGQEFDWAYRSANFDEYTQWYPLHDKCNEGYDLVPAWVNPTLAVLPTLALLCLAYSLWLAVIHRHTKKKGIS